MYQSLSWMSAPSISWRHVSLERIERPARLCGRALPDLLALVGFLGMCVGLMAEFS